MAPQHPEAPDIELHHWKPLANPWLGKLVMLLIAYSQRSANHDNHRIRPRRFALCE